MAAFLIPFIASLAAAAVASRMPKFGGSDAAGSIAGHMASNAINGRDVVTGEVNKSVQDNIQRSIQDNSQKINSAQKQVNELLPAAQPPPSQGPVAFADAIRQTTANAMDDPLKKVADAFATTFGKGGYGSG